MDNPPSIDPVPADPLLADALRRPKLGHGTTSMLTGSVVSAIGAYGFQVLGGRFLGAEGFAPVAALWTVMFLGFTMFLMPVEQFIIRRLTLGEGDHRAIRSVVPLIAGVIVGTTSLALVVVSIGLDRFFEGDVAYLAVTLALMISLGIYAVGRGFLAGHRRFRAYGWMIGAEAVVRAVLAIVAGIAGATAIGFSWALAFASLVILVSRPFSARSGDAEDHEVAARVGPAGTFLIPLLVATGASQTLLAAGPLVVGALGGREAEVSVFFATFTLFRGPLTASYNLVARVLPVFTAMVAERRTKRLDSWALRLGGLGLVGTVAGAAVGYGIGPAVIALTYGSEFRPSAGLAALATGGVVAAMGALFTTQILIARGSTHLLAATWVIALIVGAVVIFLVSGSPAIRVGWAFLVGHVVALVGVTVSARRHVS